MTSKTCNSSDNMLLDEVMTKEYSKLDYRLKRAEAILKTVSVEELMKRWNTSNKVYYKGRVIKLL